MLESLKKSISRGFAASDAIKRLENRLLIQLSSLTMKTLDFGWVVF